MLHLAALSSGCVGTVYHAYPTTPGSFCECVRNANAPGDECRIHGGTHYVTSRCQIGNVRGTATAPIIIASAGDGEVIIDGTMALPGPWTQDKDGKWTTSSGGHDILQLFIDRELQVIARYPNARWSDHGVFMAVKNWFRSKKKGAHNVETHVGLLRDQGACTDMSLCCGGCNTHDLVKSKINATGALAVMNLWRCDTGVQRITRHSLDTPNASVLHYNASWVGLCDDYAGGNGRYFVLGETKDSALLDAPEEWLLRRGVEGEVLVAERPAPGASVRGRVVDYALVGFNVSHLILANLSFHAATVSITGDVSDITLSSLVFNYSSVSNRSLGDIAPPNALTLWRSKYAEDNLPPATANFLIDDLQVRYSDGPALMVNGKNTTISDCEFEWNDWTAVGGSWPLGVAREGKAHRATTVWISNTGNDELTLSHLTFRNNGAAQSINAGGPYSNVSTRVEMCSFASQLSMQDDGSFVEGGGTPSTLYHRNWGTSTGKLGLRWDGNYGSKTGDSVLGGEMTENVLWNSSALMIKGDQHNVTRNTVFDGSDITESKPAHDRPRYQDHTSSLNSLTIPSAHVGAGTKVYNPLANQKSVFNRNIFDSVTGTGAQCPTAPNCTLPGKWGSENLIGKRSDTTWSAPGDSFDIRSELRDPFHMDFRACPNSTAARLGAGAYPAWTSIDASYWLPGRREQTMASTPLPPHGAIGAHLNTELMFLPARRALSHIVYYRYASESGAPMQRLAVLNGSLNNIAKLPEGETLTPTSVVVWRVDTLTVEGLHVTGKEWRFTTGESGLLSCSITPHPPTPPPAPPTCSSATQQYCPGVAHTGATKAGKCYTCVVTNEIELEAAGCWVHNAKGARHAFVEAFCDTSPI